MAGTFTVAKPTPNPDYTVSNKRVRVRDLTAAGTYTTGGDSLLASAFGLKRIEQFIPHGPATDGTVIYDLVYIKSTSKLKLFETGTGAAGSIEKDSAESLTGITFSVTVIGV